MLSVRRNLETLLTICIVVIVCYLVKNRNVLFRCSSDDTTSGSKGSGDVSKSASDVSTSPGDVRPGQPNADRKLILFWNKFFNDEDFRFGFGSEPFRKYGCAVSACQTTSDRRVVAEADAILVHTPLVDEMPPRPRTGQTYVMVQVEPHLAISDVLMTSMSGYFNLTMTYRRDSDVTILYAHRKRSADRAESVEVDPGARRKSVVWVASHCETPSRRELYVDELSKHIDVDVYGRCGTRSCPKKRNAICRAMYERDYRFYLSFENAICRDYVSEKLYHPLRYNIVPVVYGGADYDQLVPAHSVINALDYPDASDLARYLSYLGRNRTAYNEYFAWKRSGIWFDLNPRQRMARAMCKLCQILHDKSYVYRNYSDIRAWWTEGSCNNTFIDAMFSKRRHRS